MPKLSSYTRLFVTPTGYLVPLINSGVQNYYSTYLDFGSGLLPSQSGQSGKILATNGASGLSWVSSGGGAGTPGGNSANIQYNSAGTFAGTDNFIWNNASTRLEIKNLESSGLVFMSGSSIQTHANLFWNSGNSTLTAGHINSVTNNTYNFGSSSNNWLSGYFNYLQFTNLSGTGVGSISGNTLALQTPLGLSYGGTASTTASGAINTLVPSQAGQSGKVLATNGGEVIWAASGTGGSSSPGGLNTQVQRNISGVLSGTPNLTFNNSTLNVGGGTVGGTNELLHLTGYESAGNGIQLVLENTATTTTPTAMYVMKTRGSNDGVFFGCKNTDVYNYGIVNGITMRPGASTQDLGLSAANGVVGSANGPTIIIKSDSRIGIGNTTSWIGGNPAVGQVEIYPNAATYPNLILKGHSTQTVDMFRAYSGGVVRTAIDVSGRLNTDYAIINSGIIATTNYAANIGSATSGFGSGYFDYIRFNSLSGSSPASISGATLALTTALGLAYGGTASTTASGAINTLVPSQAGNSGKVLGTNGGEVSWVSTGTGSATSPGGNSANVQYNNAGAFGGTDNFNWNNASTRLEIKNLQASSVLFMSGSSVQSHVNLYLNSGTSTLNAGHINPVTTNTYSLGTSANTWDSGYYKSVYVSTSLTGNAFTWPQTFGWSYPSGVISGTGTNVSYEIPIPMNCVLQSGGYALARTKNSPSGHVSGLIIDILYSGPGANGPSSIWSGASGLRLTIANNTRSGEQSNFAYSGILQRGGYISMDIFNCPTGVLPQDLVVEILTMAQK